MTAQPKGSLWLTFQWPLDTFHRQFLKLCSAYTLSFFFGRNPLVRTNPEDKCSVCGIKAFDAVLAQDTLFYS